MARNKKNPEDSTGSEEASVDVDHFSIEHAQSTGEARQLPPDIEDFKEATKVVHLKTGEVYGLKVRPAKEVRHKHTHLCKNALHTWEGTEEQFREEFDKQ